MTRDLKKDENFLFCLVASYLDRADCSSTEEEECHGCPPQPLSIHNRADEDDDLKPTEHLPLYCVFYPFPHKSALETSLSAGWRTRHGSLTLTLPQQISVSFLLNTKEAPSYSLSL